MNNDPILSAQKQLLSRPFDIYHDIFHHYKVWENARQLVFSEHLQTNTRTLDAACWWHDVFRDESDSTVLRSALEQTNLSSPELEQVVAIIEQHSFGQDQTMIESRILFDADKLEYISLPRWQRAFDAFEKGLISEEEKERYVAAWNKRVPSLLGKLYYSPSNTEYDRRYREFVRWLESLGRYREGMFV